MKKTILILPFAFLALVSCGSSVGSSSDDYAVKFVTPIGAPTLAFYDQGNNANWVSSSDPSNVVLPAFGTDNYDAIVFDGTTGLNVIKKNSFNYKLAQWVSGGNFYVVSTKHKASDAFEAGSFIDGFVKTGNASQSFLKLASEKWLWNLNISADFPTGSVKWEAASPTFSRILRPILAILIIT